MRTQSKRGKALTGLLIAVIAVFGLAATAQAKLVGNYTKFAQCPYSNTEVKKCIYAVTNSGEVVLGSKKVPIVSPVTLQGGTLKPVEGTAHFVAASNGITLSKTPQPVPGGLAGLVNCKEIKEPILRFSCELAFENGLTGLNATLELAKPASEVTINETNLIGEEGVAMHLPVKMHLENPFLGSNCYVGSASAPINWDLTTGETNPPGPNTKIHGASGALEFFEEGRVAELSGNKVVENAWAAPAASGCGGFLVELLLDPIINAAAGLPASGGHNTAILNNTIFTASAIAVRKNNEENP